MPRTNKLIQKVVAAANKAELPEAVQDTTPYQPSPHDQFAAMARDWIIEHDPNFRRLWKKRSRSDRELARDCDRMNLLSYEYLSAAALELTRAMATTEIHVELRRFSPPPKSDWTASN